MAATASSPGRSVGLALVLHASPVAFLVVKAVGAIYLLWLGIKAIAARRLISFVPADRQPLERISSPACSPTC
jgi:threonine/homoserine/homoserine lactone efflux protein